MSEDKNPGGGDDWIDVLFKALRDEVLAISEDFAPKVKRRIDLVADALGVHPPSVAALLTSVSLEATNIAVGAASGDDDETEDDS